MSSQQSFQHHTEHRTGTAGDVVAEEVGRTSYLVCPFCRGLMVNLRTDSRSEGDKFGCVLCPTVIDISPEF
jgi:hypothetical protein